MFTLPTFNPSPNYIAVLNGQLMSDPFSIGSGQIPSCSKNQKTATLICQCGTRGYVVTEFRSLKLSPNLS